VLNINIDIAIDITSDLTANKSLLNCVDTASSRITEDFEKLDSYTAKKQNELKKMRDKYPIETEFLHLRVNRLRNYIEVIS
jgi:hypothetical protein